MSWTKELIEQVMTWWNKDGWTATEIAERIGKSRGAVMGKIDRIRGRKEKGSPVRRGQANPPPKKFATPKVKHRVAKVGEEDIVVLPPAPPPSLSPAEGWSGVVLAIYHLKNDECHWPFGEPVSHFCCAPVERVGAPYCAYHRQQAAPRNGMKAGE